MAVRLAIGQFKQITDDMLRFAQQIGATGIQMNAPDLPGEARWEEKDVRALVDAAEAVGLKFEALENVPVHFYDKVMLGLPGEKPESPDGKTMYPLQAHGLQCMSAGFLVDEEQPMVWRGPMATSALNQLVTETRWDDLDYLVVDMPPGTGDIQLTLSQRVPVSGAVIVTTPQDIALLDARKGLKMFEKVGVTILGIIENMSTHICSKCGHEEHIFGSGGGERIAEQYGVPLLGSLPLDLSIREQADGGQPSVVADPEGAIALAYREIARHTAAKLATAAKDYSHAFPKITIEGG